MAKSIFIEGLDGSGKSTQVKLLKQYLLDKGHDVKSFREPGGSDYFEALRKEIHFNAALKRPPISDALLTGAGRAANIEETKAALASDIWVISDRAYPSTYAYQVAQGNDWDTVKFINQLALDGFNYDYKILIDVSVDLAKERLRNSGDKLDYWESMSVAFFESARSNYIKIAEQDSITVLDGSLAISDLQGQIVKLIES